MARLIHLLIIIYFVSFRKNIKMTGSNGHDMAYYKKCMMGGILSCGITHTIVCPLDIVKCRMQVSQLLQDFSTGGKKCSVIGFTS